MVRAQFLSFAKKNKTNVIQHVPQLNQQWEVPSLGKQVPMLMRAAGVPAVARVWAGLGSAGRLVRVGGESCSVSAVEALVSVWLTGFFCLWALSEEVKRLEEETA